MGPPVAAAEEEAAGNQLVGAEAVEKLSVAEVTAAESWRSFDSSVVVVVAEEPVAVMEVESWQNFGSAAAAVVEAEHHVFVEAKGAESWQNFAAVGEVQWLWFEQTRNPQERRGYHFQEPELGQMDRLEEQPLAVVAAPEAHQKGPSDLVVPAAAAVAGEEAFAPWSVEAAGVEAAAVGGQAHHSLDPRTIVFPCTCVGSRPSTGVDWCCLEGV